MWRSRCGIGGVIGARSTRACPDHSRRPGRQRARRGPPGSHRRRSRTTHRGRCPRTGRREHRGSAAPASPSISVKPASSRASHASWTPRATPPLPECSTTMRCCSSARRPRAASSSKSRACSPSRSPRHRRRTREREPRAGRFPRAKPPLTQSSRSSPCGRHPRAASPSTRHRRIRRATSPRRARAISRALPAPSTCRASRVDRGADEQVHTGRERPPARPRHGGRGSHRDGRLRGRRASRPASTRCCSTRSRRPLPSSRRRQHQPTPATMRRRERAASRPSATSRPSRSLPTGPAGCTPSA